MAEEKLTYSDHDHHNHHIWVVVRERLKKVVEEETGDFFNDLYNTNSFLNMLADSVMPVAEQLMRDLY